MSRSGKLSSRISGLILFLSAAAALLIVGVLTATTAISFIEIEKNLVKSGLDRVEAAIERQMDEIASSAADYAVWDDTYLFVQGKLPSYASENISEALLTNLSLNLAAIYDENGRRAAAVSRSGQLVLTQLPEKLTADVPAFVPPSPDGRRMGLTRIGDRVYVFASHAVLPTDKGVEGKGTLLFAREIDAAFAALTGKLSGLTVSFRQPPEGGETAVRETETAGLKTPVIGKRVLRDVSGAPLILAVTSEPRTVFQSGHRAIILTVLATVAILILSFIALRTGFSMILIKPMERLEEFIAAGHSMDSPFETELNALCERADAIGRTAQVIKATHDEMSKLFNLQKNATERLEMEVRARTNELSRANRDLAIYQRVMEETSEGVIITDVDGNILKANDAFCRMSGYSIEELLDKNPRLVKSDRHDDAFFKAMWESIASTGRWEGEIWNRRKDGAVYPVWLSINTIADDTGTPSRFVGLSVDISKIKEAEENLNRMAFYDSLTDLPNRALFKDRFKQALSRAQRAGSRLALIYLDLDRFKNVNDSLGHYAGDELLKETAKRLKNQVRDVDTVCRLGGDEFTVILENINSSGDAASVARKILSAMREAFHIQETEVFVGTSIGIALFPYDGTEADELIKRADAAMYEAKEHGRGQLRFASGESGVSSLRRLETETRMRKGIERNEFFLHFQPQVSAGGAEFGKATGIIGAEALIRWKPAGEKTVPPDSFIDVAEETGLIVQMGAFVLKKACEEAKRWNDSGYPLQISVNVSQMQFDRGRIIDQVNDALSATGLKPEYLKLEITESLFSRDMDNMVNVMKEIKGLGVSFAVDDFGTGYSSLRYIDRLPIDSLKIDKSFIQRIDSRYEGGEIATAVVALARSFGLESIAEGVETAEQLDALKSRGCDSIQGYYVSRPLNSDDFMSFIRAKDLLAELDAPA